MKSHAISRPRDFPSLRGGAEHHDGSRSSAGGEESKFVDDYLPALLAQAHQLVAGEFHTVVGEHGFSPSEWRVLATLAGGEPLSIGRIAQIVVMKQPTLTKVLDRMEACGHVRRLPHDEDRRITLVRITPAGSKAAAKLIPLAQAHERRVLAPFGAARAAELKETLARLIAQAQRSG